MISVIVPIYKVEKYLERCITSIVRQTYADLEIILVDDGSPDGSPAICDRWEQKEGRIKVIHKQNGGLSDARNAGLELASGEYIIFVDSDDWIAPNMAEILLDNLNEAEADISECRAQKVSGQEEVKVGPGGTVSAFSTEEALGALIREQPLKQTVWNKLYKRDVLPKEGFPVGKVHEDEFFTYRAFGNSKKIVFTDAALYYYFQRSDSIMGERFSLKRLDSLDGRFGRYQYVKEYFPDLVFEAKKDLFFLCLFYYQKALASKEKELRIGSFRQIKDYCSAVRFSEQEKKMLSQKDRVWVSLSEKSLHTCCNLRNLLRIGV